MLALTLGAVVAYIAATFDPRDLIPARSISSEDKTGRTLEIRGDDRAFVLARCRRAPERPVAERARQHANFSRASKARASRSSSDRCLRREIVATELTLAGAHVRVTRDEHGRLNIADLFEGEGGPPRFDIGRVAIERSTLTYRDAASGAQYELGAIALETGRVAPGVVTPLVWRER